MVSTPAALCGGHEIPLLATEMTGRASGTRATAQRQMFETIERVRLPASTATIGAALAALLTCVRDASLWRAVLCVQDTVVEDVEFDETAQIPVAHVRPRRAGCGRCGLCGARARRGAGQTRALYQQVAWLATC
jgi:hypothetical protein